MRKILSTPTQKAAADASDCKPTTINTVITEFKDEARRTGIKSASKKFEVEDEVDSLLDISQQIAANHLSIMNALEGYTVSSELKQADVDPKDASSFVQSLMTAFSDQKISPTQGVDYSKELLALYQETGKTYYELIDEYKDTNQTNTRLKGENTELINDINENKYKLDYAIKYYNTTLEELIKFNDTKKALRGKGLEIGDLHRLLILLVNLSKMGYDAKKVAQLYSSYLDVEGKVSELDKTRGKLEHRNSELNINLKSLRESIQSVENEVIAEIRRTASKSKGELVNSINEMKSASANISNSIEANREVIETHMETATTNIDRLDKRVNDLFLKLGETYALMPILQLLNGSPLEQLTLDISMVLLLAKYRKHLSKRSPSVTSIYLQNLVEEMSRKVMSGHG